ncbi:MAG: hypothetical protein A3K19_02235 [Lentisphaerae bacterium RIFOXYB12_FULL_65_16]|nr:MAG: hypothetical protein A3K18_14025 [Lentisphaerae bacterium RIFOXYA12_64_32]OGV86695.1 MAG: hypothetical protein A3K19_02235 [Lentisphaerae bacterium RIFOXYB12_FULL_65_16]
MAFSPWNALAENRLMGGTNRLRQAVYLASQEKRAAKSLLCIFVAGRTASPFSLPDHGRVTPHSAGTLTRIIFLT